MVAPLLDNGEKKYEARRNFRKSSVPIGKKTPHLRKGKATEYLAQANKGHNNTIQVYSVTVMTYVIALEDGQSARGHLSLLHRCTRLRCPRLDCPPTC